MSQPRTPPPRAMAMRAADAALPAQSVPQDGLWQLYSGAVIAVFIRELRDTGPVEVIIDGATVQAERATLPALGDHLPWEPIGTWSSIEINRETGAISARLSLLTNPDPANPLFESAERIGAMLKQGFPMQASVGCEPAAGGTYEPILAPTTINGRTVAPKPGVPLYALRNGSLFETSLVLWGADSDTGRLAAARTTTPQGDPMGEPTTRERLDRLTARFGAARRPTIALRLAEGATDDEIADSCKQEDDAAMAAKDAKIADLTAKLAAAEAKLADLAKADGGGTGAKEDPKTATEAMRLTGKTGLAARREAARRFPTLF